MRAQLRNILIWAGLTAVVSGPALVVVSILRESHWHVTNIGLALAIVGLLMIMFGYMLRVTGTIGEIYGLGYRDGLAKGRKEGRRVAKPVVVQLGGKNGRRHKPLEGA